MSGCGDRGVQQVAETRSIEGKTAPQATEPSSAERFGFVPPVAPEHGHGQPAPYAWDTPEGWQEAATTTMRVANFTIGEAECYLTALGGTGGGIAMIVNRWRGQVGLEALAEEEIAALPTVTLLGQQAVCVEAEGVFGGMADDVHVGMDGQKQGYSLLGAILMAENKALFVKMVGPSKIVGAERERFGQFCASLREEAHAAHAAGGEAAGTPHAAGGAAADAPLDPPQFDWEAPDAWTKGPDQTMRVVSYGVGGNGAAECYVTALQGTGGGLEANINRWCSQIGQDALSPEAIAALPRVTVLGQESAVIELTGDYSGMGDTAQASSMLLGAICELPAETIFVKMTGPETVVRAEKEGFLAFCRSLKRSAQ